MKKRKKRRRKRKEKTKGGEEGREREGVLQFFHEIETSKSKKFFKKRNSCMLVTIHTYLYLGT